MLHLVDLSSQLFLPPPNPSASHSIASSYSQSRWPLASLEPPSRYQLVPSNMGLFGRKGSRANTNGNINATPSSRTSSSSIKSPPLTKVVNGTPFSSPSVQDITLPGPPDPTLDPAAYLRSIYAVRERTQLVYQRAKRNQLNHFDVDGSKFRDTAEYVVSIIKVKLSKKFCHSPTDSRYRETSPRTTTRFPLTVDGNILKPAVDLV